MIYVSFPNAAALHKYVVDESILQSNIVQIVFGDGHWHLFYY